MEPSLFAWAQEALSNHLHESAIFVAERLVAEANSERNRHLLATCYYASGAANRAASILQGASSSENRYLLALSQIKCQKLGEAQAALLGPNVSDPAAEADVPNGAAGLYLMGAICLKQQQRTRAIKYFTRCLALNPCMWCAYEALCQLGAALPEPPAGLVAAPAMCRPGSFGGADPPALSSPLFAAAATPASPAVGRGAPLFTPSDAGGTAAPGGGGGGGGAPLSAALAASGGGAATPAMHTPAGQPPASALPSPSRHRRAGSAGSSIAATPDDAGDAGRKGSMQPPPPAGRRGRVVGGGAASAVPVRRSSRLSSGGSAKEADSSEMPPPPPPSALSVGGGGGGGGGGVDEDDDEGELRAQRLLRQCASAYRLLCLYRCQESVAAFDALPQRHRETAWALSQVGRAHFRNSPQFCAILRHLSGARRCRAHFEMVQYPEAARLRARAAAAPHRLCGAELDDPVAPEARGAAVLPRQAMRRLRPALWRTRAASSATASPSRRSTTRPSSSSSARDPGAASTGLGATAISTPTRSPVCSSACLPPQVQPDLAYAYTLCGHEYSANDDFEKAMAFYRSAIRRRAPLQRVVRPRNIYFRQEPSRDPTPHASPRSSPPSGTASATSTSAA